MNAVITAGGPIDGEYAQLARTTLKALAPVRHRTMLERTIIALRDAGVYRIAVVGNDAVAQAVGGTVQRIVPDAGSGAGNVLAALGAWDGDDAPLLYLTCDMPYITSGALASFLGHVPQGALAMAVTEHDDFVARFPHAPPFGITLAGERVVNGGAFYIPAGGAKKIASFATALFDARKSPWRMATIAGPMLLVRFMLGRCSIGALETRARMLLEMDVTAIRRAPPELAYDVDTVDDYRYALDHE